MRTGAPGDAPAVELESIPAITVVAEESGADRGALTAFVVWLAGFLFLLALLLYDLIAGLFHG